MTALTRRLALGVLGGALVASVARAQLQALRVEALFAGKVDDKGFMEAGYRGLLRARDQLGAAVGHIEGVKPQKELLAAALRQLAERKPGLVIAHGGQNNEAAAETAAAFPDVRFVVTQGAVKGPNLSSYEVLQEQSAFLAGVFAALTSKTRIVGHMSGIRVKPGLKGRAAYLAGVAWADPGVRVLTNFSGNQDDNALSARIAGAMADAGADVIFTMLNAGRTGVTEICRLRKISQIGNVVDWTAMAPDVFSASAIADVSLAVFAAAHDVAKGSFAGGTMHRIGLENPEAVRLALRADAPAAARAKVEDASKAIVAGEIKNPENWAGQEFATPG